jgi:hypothetical protein
MTSPVAALGNGGESLAGDDGLKNRHFDVVCGGIKKLLSSVSVASESSNESLLARWHGRITAALLIS